MKKLLVSVLAIAGLVACTQETTLVQKGNAPMEFGAAFVENATRANAAVDPSTTTESIKGFDVWGFMDSPEGVVFEGEDVTRSEGNFIYVNTQYWIPGHTYYFAALAPMNSANWDLNTAKASDKGAGVVTFENINGTEDLLYAATAVDATKIQVGEAPVDKVRFQFSHLLSKVKFSFTNGFDNDNAYIDVKNVKMVAPSKATIDLAVENWWDNDDWKLVDAVPVTLEFGDACAKTAVGVKQVTDNERLTIPAAATQSYKVTFEVALYFGDVLAFTKTLESNIENVALEMGKAYNFKATLDETNISGEDGKELLPIVFDVEEVKEWENAAEQDITVDGYITNMVLDADFEANEMVKIAGNLNGNGHTLSAVAGVDYVGVNASARLIETKDDTTIENIIIDGKNVKVTNSKDTYGIRGIYTTGTGDVVVKNAKIYNCTYAINANNAGTISVINSTLQGWNSYGGTTKCLFDTVTFIDGEHHNFRPYNNTVCKNCDFGAGVVIDLSEFIGTSIEFENCTVAGRPLTAADVTAPKNADAKVIINLAVTEAPAKEGLVQNIENVENMTIDGGGFFTRGIYITKGGVYNVKNVVVKNVVYAINVSVDDYVTLNVEDSTLEGWTSYGDKTTASFKNVKFECGKYANLKAYTSTVLEGCSFEAGFMIDFEEIEAGETLTFKNCTYNGQPMTEESFINGTVKIDGDFTDKIAF